MSRVISRIVIVFSLSVGIITFSFPQDIPSAQEIIAHVQQKYSTMNDASADFVQTSKLRFRENELSQSGSVKIKRGNKYRIILSDQEIVTDGKTVWIYSPVTKQVLIDNFKENSLAFSPEKFLQGFPKNFIAGNVQKENDLLKVSLIPSSKKNNSAVFSALAMWIDQKDWSIAKIEYTDRNQTKNSVVLTKRMFNSGISESQFQFVPNDSMNVVDARTLR